MVTEQFYCRKILCACFYFIWLWLLVAIMKRCAVQCAVQLHRTCLSIFIPFQQQSRIMLTVRKKLLLRTFHTKIVAMEIAMMKIFNNCIVCRLNNNYFPLNESSSRYQQCFVYSITAYKNTYLKNYSKTSNAIILAPYRYTKKATHCT